MKVEDDLSAIKRDLKELDEMIAKLPTKGDWTRAMALTTFATGLIILFGASLAAWIATL